MASSGRSPTSPSNSSPTVNLIELASAVKEPYRSHPASSSTFQRGRCLLDSTILEESGPGSTSTTPKPTSPPSSFATAPFTIPRNAPDLVSDSQGGIDYFRRSLELLCEKRVLLQHLIEKNEYIDTLKADLGKAIIELKEFQEFHDAESTNLEAERREWMERCKKLERSYKERLDEETARANGLEQLVDRLERKCDEADACDNIKCDLENRIQELEKEVEKSRRSVGNSSNVRQLEAERQNWMDHARKYESDLRSMMTEMTTTQQKYEAVSRELEILRQRQRNDSGGSGLAQILPQGSAIMEMGQKIRLEQKLQNLRKENSKLLKENQDLKSDRLDLIRQLGEKENDHSGGGDALVVEKSVRRSASECCEYRGNATLPLQDLGVINSPAGQLFTSVSADPAETGHKKRFFPTPSKRS